VLEQNKQCQCSRHLKLATKRAVYVCMYVFIYFWATVRKTARPMLSDACPVCLSVLSGPVLSVRDGVLWPNGWTDQDETSHAGRLRPCPHCVKWGPSSPPEKRHSPQFSAHVRCGQTAGWIKMPLGMQVRLGPGDCVLDG